MHRNRLRKSSTVTARQSKFRNSPRYRRLACEPLESRLAFNIAPQTPTISEPSFDGKIVNYQDAHMEAGPFVDADASDTHTATQWEIWTTGGGAQRVWVFNPTGDAVERVHTHLGDGTFENSHAGRTTLLPNTGYQLRVRFRDSSNEAATEWSSFSTRSFTTGDLSEVFPLSVVDVITAPAPLWQSTLGSNVILPGGTNPPSMVIESETGALLLRYRGVDGVTNDITNPIPLADHAEARVRFVSGDAPLVVPESNLTFTDDHGESHTVYLPAISLAANQQAVYWVSAGGSTYADLVSQTEPDFSTLARGAPVPWTVAAGYKVEIVSTGFQLPVNLTFIPNAGTNPTDPYYYVTELYGTIKVVRRNGTVSDYATNLLNFNPTGNFPGSGEQGLTGIAVDPVSGDVFAAMVYSSVPGIENVAHYPKVVRFHSTDGGLTAATQTAILDMVGEQQGQSHQISNVTIGPDGKLYVHNGDGFDASTAQNLNSYRGKILRMNLDGTAPTDNPFYNASNGITATDYVYAYGFRNAFGGGWRQADGKHYTVENGPSVDRFAQVNSGVNYGWNGSDASMATNALYNWNPATAPVNIAFVQSGTFGGSGFGADKLGHAFVTQSGGTWATGPQGNAKNITEFVLDAAGNRLSGPTPLVSYNGSGKATAAGLAAGPDGLYFTDLYKDLNYATPIDRGANVLRVRYVGTADFSADVRVGESAPLTVNFTDISTVPGASAWVWDFGDGDTSALQNPSHTFTSDGVYTVRLSVTGSGGTVTSTKVSYIRVGTVVEPGLTATYYDNIDLSGASVSRVDTTVNFDWGTGSPDPAIGEDTFSARWTGQVEPQFSETYTFYTVSDDGVRLWVNDQLIVDNWTDHAPTENSGTVALLAGQRYDIRMEMFENGGGAVAKLLWSSVSTAKEVIPAERLFADVMLPEAPHDLVATAISSTSIQLQWHDHANNEDGFRVERSSDGANFTQIATPGPNSETYTDTGLSGGDTYYYRVRSYNDAGNSSYSEIVSATTSIGFTTTEVASGMTSPVTLDIAPDGRVFVAFQDGRIGILQNDQLLPTLFGALAADATGERGLQGIELDPDFATNGYIYVYYTALNPSPHNRVSRIQADPTNPNLMLAGSETVLLDLPLFSSLPDNTNPIWHMGGAIHVAPDGTLRIQTGDHLNSSQVQSVNTMLGKVLRINRDGTLPTNNPYYNAADGITAQDYVWALGLRNPFSGDIDPVTGRYFIGDVGQGNYEEINDATLAGRNFGWPTTEGPFNQATYPNFTQPTLAYDHSEDYAITGGVFYPTTATQFPAEYRGKYFYSQFGAGVIKFIDPDNPITPTTFLIDQAFPMNLEVSPDGSLYYVVRGAGAGGAPGTGTGKIIKVQYVSNQPPSISEQPTNVLVSVGHDAMFTASAQGSAPIGFQWQRKDVGGSQFTDIVGATSATYTLAEAPLAANGAQFRLVVANPYGTDTSDAATLTVTTNLPPIASITSPAAGTTYQGGSTFTFAGGALDSEDGSLPATALTWWIDFHHDTHSHPFLAPTTGIASGQFTIPVVSETDPDVYYRIHLRAIDSIGLVHETIRDVTPLKANYTLTTNIPGLSLTLDGQPVAAPYTFQGVVNLQRSLGAPEFQTVGGMTYQFVGWSDGGAATHTILTPAIDSTYTANYQVAPFVYLSDLPFVGTPTNGWGPVERDRSNGENAVGDGNTISLRGNTYGKGLGAHAASESIFNLGGAYTQLLTDIGIDDETGGNGSVVFQIFADGVSVFTSGTLTGTSAIQSVNLNVANVNQLRLVVTDAGDGNGYDHADWAGARLLAVPATAPTGLAAIALSANHIQLDWQDNSDTESGFRIERSPNGIDGWALLTTVAANATSYLDPTVAANTRYHYRVRALAGAGDSAFSNVANALTTDVFRINFQPATSPVPDGYFADGGAIFASRGNGYSYGWNADNSSTTRDRSAVADQRYDTLQHMQKPENPNAFWEIAVPNGTYQVHLVSGDPSNFDGYYALNIEGVLTINGAPTTDVRFLEATTNISVTDSRLTFSNASGSQNNKISFVDINPVPTADILDILPDPRLTVVNTVTISFSEPVTGFDLADLSLSRSGGSNLLNGAQSLSTTDNQTWTLAGLAGVTLTPGNYTLSLEAAGSGIIDVTGAALVASAADSFVRQNNPPTVSDVGDQFTDEDVSLLAIPFTVGDLETATGSLLVSAQSTNPTLIPVGNITFGGSGANRTVSVAPASNLFGTSTITIQVSDGTNTTTDTFVVTVNSVNDLPTITDIVDQSVSSGTSTGPISFDISDIETTAASLTLTATSTNTTLIPLGNIEFGGSGANRTVTITPAAGQSGTSTIGVTVSDGNGGTRVDTFVVTVTPAAAATVVDRHLFYNRSFFDGNNAAANTADDNAIDDGKEALFPGEVSGFRNVSGYSRGINGIMIDVANLPASSLTAADFQFRVGNSNDLSSWTSAPLPSITVRDGAGVGGSDRITLIWADNAIEKKWLQVRLMNSTSTGLSAPDTFYFGNAIGETGEGSNPSFYLVNATDTQNIKLNGRSALFPAEPEFPFDINKDRLVNATDASLSRLNVTSVLTALRAITAPTVGGSNLTVDAGATNQTSLQIATGLSFKGATPPGADDRKTSQPILQQPVTSQPGNVERTSQASILPPKAVDELMLENFDIFLLQSIIEADYSLINRAGVSSRIGAND